MSLTNSQRSARLDLAEAYRSRPTPLGIGLKNQCAVGLAIEIARAHGETLRDRFGGTSAFWKAAIRGNKAIEPGERNEVMARFVTRDLA